MYWQHHYWGMHGFWWIFWAAIIALLLFKAWPGFRAWPGDSRVGGDSALDALRRRYAAGEIGDEEYQHRLEVLAPDLKTSESQDKGHDRHKAPAKGDTRAHAK